VPHLLGADALRLDFGTGVVLDSVSLGLDDGDRVGLVGANGAGKSSLLRLIAGLATPTDGRVTRSTGVTLEYVAQDDAAGGAETVARAIVGRTDEHEWASDPRVREVMAGLVPDLPADASLSTLSGGQRQRVALARALVKPVDVLLLDEPTNHLDIEGVAWLAEHLRERWSSGSGALVVATHDRWFLDAVTLATWEVHDGTVEKYEGGYAAYVLQRLERARIATATERRRQNLLRKELAWLRRGAPARTSKPKFRVEAANALIEDVPPIRDEAALVRLAAARQGKEVVSLLDCGVVYGEGDGAKEVLRDITWRIGPGERTGILGENGAGKSTLLGLITGAVEPTSGRVRRGISTRVATLTQHASGLDEHARTTIHALVKGFSSTTLEDGSVLRSEDLLDRLGFTSAQRLTPVGRLSGGQRRRLQLLLVMLEEPNVLVLDEPTNDLDTDMLTAIEDLLDGWPGTLIVVSHDRYLLERVTDHQYAIIDSGLRHLPGGVDEYVALARERRATGDGIGTFGTSPDHTARRPKDGARERKRAKESASIERRLLKIEGLQQSLNDRMLDCDCADYRGLADLSAESDALTREREELERRWLSLAEASEDDAGGR
jgi:ATPase subunit of ABC transporter with duplicated ATPase domains